jgi:hypothetical protein
MALLFMDSFDHYALTNLQEKYNWRNGNVTIATGAGRNGTSALRCNDYYADFLIKGVPATSNTFTIGFAFKPTSWNWTFVNLGEAGTHHIGLRVENNGMLAVHRIGGANWEYGGGTMLCQSLAGLIQLNLWYHIQLKIVVADAPSGTVDLRLNQVMVASNPGVDTRSGGTGIINTFYLGCYAYYDDLWVCDGAGPAPWNSFLGDCRVDALFPTANGTTVGWAASTGTNWECVDDPLPNSDTDFNSAVSAGPVDTFVTQNSPVPGSVIYGVQQCLHTRKTDAGAASIAPVVRVGGVDYVGANYEPSTLYSTITQVRAANPQTGAQWTESEFNGAEFGYKRTV